jgi:acetoin utilization protein AcuB
MTPSPHCIGRDQKLSRAHEVMRAHGLRHLPVLEGGKLVGIVSQRDLYFVETIRGVDADKDLVEDAMTSDAFQVKTTASLKKVVDAMARRRLGSAVVVEGGKVVGVFTTTDAMRTLGTMLGATRAG